MIRHAIAIVTMMFGVSAASGALFTDDFETYNSTAEMNAAGNWGDNGQTGNPATLQTSGGAPGQFMFHPGGATAQHNFTPTAPTDTAPLVFQFDLIDDGVGNKRITGGLRDNGGGAGLNTLIEMGRYNNLANVEAGGAVTDGYGIRTVFIDGTPAGNGGWVVFPGDPAIEAGTHNLKATLRASDITFELDLQDDGVVDAVRVINTGDGANKAYNVMRLGGPSDLSSAGGGAGFDNVSIGLFEPDVQLATVFGTGVSSTGAALPGNAVDPHFTVTPVSSFSAPVTMTPGAPTFVVPQDGFPIPPWAPNSATSAWISSSQNDDANADPGFYDYVLSFDLENPNFFIEGEWAADNEVGQLFVNGMPTSMGVAGFNALTPFLIEEGFVTGTNVLTFRLENFGPGVNPAGLRVNITDFGSTAVPEPTSALLALLALGAMSTRRRRIA